MSSKVNRYNFCINSSEKSRKKQALNEAQVLASVTALDENPNVVHYYQAWFEEDNMYLVMEYCPTSLKNIKTQCKHKGFSESEILKILKDVLNGLQNLHDLKIVHLDIKTGTIVENDV